MAKKKKEVRLAEAYNFIFKSEKGKEVLYDLIRRGHMLDASKPNSDIFSVGLREGRRALVLYILSQVKTDPMALDRLLDEENDDILDTI